jgi:hypothetical protein
MSVLDHIPLDSVHILAKNIASSCSAVIGVELFDGSNGSRGLYKYSVLQKDIYEQVGFKTKIWDFVPLDLQYDVESSPLWIYVGLK